MVLCCAGILFLLWGAGVQAQGGTDEEPSVILVPPPEEEEGGEAASVSLISMEAYREVLASGRYRVGPGDEFLVYITGMEEPFFSKVMAEGGLFIPSVGSIRVAGMSLLEMGIAAEKAFKQAFKKGEITLELNRLRNFPVTVVGVVGVPEVITASGIERISDVLSKSKGLGSNASRRNIRIVKQIDLEPGTWERVRTIENPLDYLGVEGISQRVDLELYGITGDSKYNPFVEDGDLIVAPPQAGQIGMMGAVQRGGFFYEFVKGDRISDILTLGQGLLPGYDPDKVVLFRYTPDRNKKITIPVDIEGVLNGDRQADLLLQPEDWLVVRHLPGYSPRSTVRVTGEVVYPGFYVVEKNETTLREAIEIAGGFTEDASLWEARVMRGDQEVRDPELERIASVPVADRTEDDNQYFIMKSREKLGQMVVDFVALFEKGDESQNITLLPDDVIVVPPTPRTVIVSGQAAYPGAVIYNPAFTVWDYIAKAGGLGWRASKDIRVIKVRTGEMQRARDVVQIDPGDRIWIKEKPERDYWTIFTQAMAVVGQVSTVVLLYATLTQ